MFERCPILLDFDILYTLHQQTPVADMFDIHPETLTFTQSKNGIKGKAKIF